jgi:hypothetical protein
VAKWERSCQNQTTRRRSSSRCSSSSG